MKRYLLILSVFSSIYCSVPDIPNFDEFTPAEQLRIAQSSIPVPAITLRLPTISIKFDILISGETILYDSPVFTLDGQVVACQICGKPPMQIEVTNGKLKCFCFSHIPRKRGSFLD